MTSAHSVSPVVDTDGPFAEWRAWSKHRWGAPLERFRRKMRRDHDGQIAAVEAPEDLGAVLDAGFAVEASGWKGAAGTAILSSPATTAFYRRVAEAFHARDALRVSTITLDGRLAAFDLCLLVDGRLYLLKTGFDESFRKLAPGLVLRLSVIERCFELGLRAHELLGDQAEWKAKFATSERPHVQWTGYGRNGRGVRSYAVRRGQRAIVQTVRAGADAISRPFPTQPRLPRQTPAP
jgi:CelD/BcsL family acetyltransferase involved in cellulose biosynthesis